MPFMQTHSIHNTFVIPAHPVPAYPINTERSKRLHNPVLGRKGTVFSTKHNRIINESIIACLHACPPSSL